MRAGDYPLPGEDRVASVVLLSGVTDVPRIEALRRRVTEASQSTERTASGDGAGVEDVIDDGLDPLF